MSWFFFAIIGYVCAALVSLLDKYIVKSRIPDPPVYAFFVGIFSVFAFVLIPVFGQLMFFGWELTVLSLLSGALFIFGLVALYGAIRKSEISRIAPLVGSITAAFALLFSILGWFVDVYDPPGAASVGAFAFLVFGGLLLSFSLPLKRGMFIKGAFEAFVAGIFIAAFFVIFKIVGEEQDFISVFVWSRIGMLFGAFALFAYRPFRKRIWKSICIFCRGQHMRRSAGTFGYFTLNKILGGLGYLAISYAVFVGPVVTVQAMTSIQYALVVMFAFVASRFWPHIFQEVYNRNTWIQKGIALALIAVGISLAAASGGAKFF